MRAALLLLVPASMLAGCANDRGDGGGAARSFSAAGFDRVALLGPDSVSVRTGPAFSVRADGDAQDLDALRVEVVDGELRVDRAARAGSWLGWMRPTPARVRVQVTMPVIRGAALSGAGSLDLDGAVAPSFEGGVAGAGTLRIVGLNARTALFKLSGAGNISVAGKAADVTLEVAGAGTVSAERLAARDIAVSLSGVGTVAAHATGRADVRLSGVGRVEITGTDDCRISKTGVGTARCARQPA